MAIPKLHALNGKILNIVIFLLCTSIGLLLSLRTLGAFFLSDDFEILKAVSGKWGGAWFAHRFFRPLANGSFFLDYHLWGLNPTGYHLTNILLHCGAAFLVYRIAERLFRGQEVSDVHSRGVAFLCGLWFLVFPGHAEAVAWIAGRTDLLAVFFGLLSFFYYIRFRWEGGGFRLCLSLGAFFAGLLSKESILLLPFIFLLWDLTLRKKPVEQSGGRWLDFPILSVFAVLLIYMLLRYWSLGVLLGGYEGRGFEFSWMLDVSRKFLLRSFLPAGSFHFMILKWKADLLVGLLLVIYAGWSRKRRQGVFFLLAGSLGLALAPVLNLDIALDNGFSERFIYFSSVFAALIWGWLALEAAKRWKYSWVMVLGLVFLLWQGGLFWRVNGNWREAGDISKSLLASYHRQAERSADAQDRVFIVNLPDSLNGCYIFRMGFQDAARLFYGLEKKVIGVATCGLENRKAQGELTKISQTDYLLTLKRAYIVQRPVPSRPPFYRITHSDQGALTIRMEGEFVRAKLLYYSGGQLHRF